MEASGLGVRSFCQAVCRMQSGDRRATVKRSEFNYKAGYKQANAQ